MLYLFPTQSITLVLTDVNIGITSPETLLSTYRCLTELSYRASAEKGRKGVFGVIAALGVVKFNRRAIRPG
jgi:hypothetical protein